MEVVSFRRFIWPRRRTSEDNLSVGRGLPFWVHLVVGLLWAYSPRNAPKPSPYKPTDPHRTPDPSRVAPELSSPWADVRPCRQPSDCLSASALTSYIVQSTRRRPRFFSTTTCKTLQWRRHGLTARQMLVADGFLSWVGSVKSKKIYRQNAPTQTLPDRFSILPFLDHSKIMSLHEMCWSLWDI